MGPFFYGYLNSKKGQSRHLPFWSYQVGTWEVEPKADDEEGGTSRTISLSSVEALKSYKNQTTGQSSHILLAFLVSSQNRTEVISGFRPKA